MHVNEVDGPGADPSPAGGRPRPRALLTGLAVVAALALVGLFVVLEVRGGDDEGAGGPDGTGTTAVASAGPTPTPSPADSEHGDDGLPRDTDGNLIPPRASPPAPDVTGRESGQPAPAGARETAEGFGRAFTDTRGGQVAWFNRLAPFLTQENVDTYRVVPVDNVPRGALVRTDVQTPGNRVAQAVLTYDSGLVLDVTLAHNGEKWQVTKIDRAGPNAGNTG